MKHFACVLLVFTTFLTGCARTPGVAETNFLSDYSKLVLVDEHRASYRSPEVRNYKSFIINPLEFRLPLEKLDEQESKQAADHFTHKLTQALEKRGCTVTKAPGPGVARLRVAMTDVARSTWWMKLHPATKLAGAGTGGAAMEGELVDSVTGKQLGAAVQASPGNQFNIFNFSTVADVNSAIDKWVDLAAQRFDELRAGT